MSTPSAAIVLALTALLSPDVGAQCVSSARSLFDEDGANRAAPQSQDKVASISKPRHRIPGCPKRATVNPKADKPAERITVESGSEVSQPLTAVALASDFSGLRFWHEGANVADRTSYRFKTGDKVSFFFETNRPGFLYVISFDNNGKPYPSLFPPTGESPVVRAFSPVSFGASFVDSPGIEKVYALFSAGPLQDVYAIARAVGSKGTTGVAGIQFDYRLADARGRVSRSRGLVPDNSKSSQASAVGASNAELRDFPVQVLTLELVHESR